MGADKGNMRTEKEEKCKIIQDKKGTETKRRRWEEELEGESVSMKEERPR